MGDRRSSMRGCPFAKFNTPLPIANRTRTGTYARQLARYESVGGRDVAHLGASSGTITDEYEVHTSIVHEYVI